MNYIAGFTVTIFNLLCLLVVGRFSYSFSHYLLPSLLFGNVFADSANNADCILKSRANHPFPIPCPEVIASMVLPHSLIYREEEEYSDLPACRISETVSSLVLKLGLHIVVGSSRLDNHSQ